VNTPFQPPTIISLFEPINSADTGSPRERLIQHAPIMFMHRLNEFNMIIQMAICSINNQLSSFLGLLIANVSTNATRLKRQAE
mgnify:CR=1